MSAKLMFKAIAMRSLGTALSPAGRCGKLLILAYHRVLEAPDPVIDRGVTAAQFDWQMTTLAREFNVLTLTEAVRRITENSLPPRAVVVTFDDGYADNFTIALPILKKWSMPATFFVAASFLDGGRMWNDTVIEAISRAPRSVLDFESLGLGQFHLRSSSERRQAIEVLLKKLKYLPLAERDEMANRLAKTAAASLPDNLMMTASQVAALSGEGMEIGGHTLSHPILARLPAEQAEMEIVEGRRRLEEITGRKIRVFAYPNGRPGVDYHRCHVDMVCRADFEAAVSTAWGSARRGDDLWQLPRLGSWDPTPFKFGLRLLSAYLEKPAERV
ncbi:MAG: polysaccharide deacetylase family protein [Gammaproteobacteria bacterium]